MARKPSFSNLIHSTRRERGLSVAEVAERVGVSVASSYLWKTDRGRPRDENLSALCKALKLPIGATKELAAI
jgi:transcriptional regulator with XRE-family HTH domain